MSLVEQEIVHPIPEVIDPKVERGAVLLDERMPGWADKIDLETLDTHGIVNCPLGQIYGTFGRGVQELWGPGSQPYEVYHRHGFYTFYTDDEYAEIQQSWRLAVLSRRVR